MGYAEVLAVAALFRGARPEEFAELERFCRRRHFEHANYLWHAGDAADAMFVIVSGEVVLSRLGPDGEEFMVEAYHEGDACGQLPFFDLVPVRVVDARAGTALDVVEIPREALITHLRAHPGLMMRMLGVYSRWIRQRDLNASELAFQHLAGKIACKLLDLSETYGQRCDDGLLIRRHFAQHELAAMVGASRESVNRALQRLLNNGDVIRRAGELVIPDVDKLRLRYAWSAPAEWELSRSVDRPTRSSTAG
ncbi:MAG TPA: Crp/Fnr family transcriptional regulator [Candidatus Dormibacteraeota bacterium]|nr:Crp/Fnr family transcriptional regulator [Candidatus Dormibacteraeota bacterium]